MYSPFLGGMDANNNIHFLQTYVFKAIKKDIYINQWIPSTITSTTKPMVCTTDNLCYSVTLILFEGSAAKLTTIQKFMYMPLIRHTSELISLVIFNIPYFSNVVNIFMVILYNFTYYVLYNMNKFYKYKKFPHQDIKIVTICETTQCPLKSPPKLTTYSVKSMVSSFSVIIKLAVLPLIII